VVQPEPIRTRTMHGIYSVVHTFTGNIFRIDR